MELAGKNQAGIDTSISPEQPDLLELNLSHIANFHVALQCQSVQFLIFWPLLIKRVCVCVCVCVCGGDWGGGGVGLFTDKCTQISRIERCLWLTWLRLCKVLGCG